MQTTATFHSGFPQKLINIILVLSVLLTVGYFTANVSQHAKDKHGSDAVSAASCVGGAPTGTYIYWRDRDDTVGLICYLIIDGSGKWGLNFFNGVEKEMTSENMNEGLVEIRSSTPNSSFIKNKLTRFEQVDKYMRNQGFDLIHKPTGTP